MYPEFPGGWKCCLQAAVSHHNRSHTSALGCSPQYAAFGEPAYLPADDTLEIKTKLHLEETKKTAESQRKHRESLKRAFDKRHNNKIPNITLGDLVLIRKGYDSHSTKLLGPFKVTKTATKDGILKTIGYVTEDGVMEIAAISNVIPYIQRRDKTKPGRV